MGRITLQGRYGTREGLTGTLKRGGKRSSGEAAKANPLRGGLRGVTETETMENFAGSLLQVEIEQGSLKPNYDHKGRTRMKPSPRVKLFSPTFRTWIGQWNVRTLCLRKVLNIRWPEVISNEELWERTQQSHIEESITEEKKVEMDRAYATEA